MQPLRNCNGPTIRIGREILCLPYAGFFLYIIHKYEIFPLSYTSWSCEIFYIVYLNKISHILPHPTKLLIFCPHLILVQKKILYSKVSQSSSVCRLFHLFFQASTHPDGKKNLHEQSVVFFA